MIQTVRENLKKYREREGISQEALSRKCNYDKTYVGKIERGDTNPSIEAVLRISNELEVAPTKFFEEETSERPDVFRQQFQDFSGSIGELFVDVFANLPSIAFLTNDEGEILQLNGAAKKLLKADANDPLGRKLSELSVWRQSGLNPSLFDELCDLAVINKKATCRTSLRYKGKEVDLQIQVSFAEAGEESSSFIIFQIFFVEETTDRTLMGDHYELFRQ